MSVGGPEFLTQRPPAVRGDQELAEPVRRIFSFARLELVPSGGYAGERLRRFRGGIKAAGEIAEREQVVGGEVAAEKRQRAGGRRRADEQLGAREIEIEAVAAAEREGAQVALGAG